jgi:hypothetical protein
VLKDQKMNMIEAEKKKKKKKKKVGHFSPPAPQQKAFGTGGKNKGVDNKVDFPGWVNKNAAKVDIDDGFVEKVLLLE